VHVTTAPGASPPAGHVTVTLSSVTVIGPANVTLPLFVTLYVYEITCPTWSYASGVAVLSMLSAGVRTIGIDRLSVAAGASFDVAVAVFARLPLAPAGEPFASSSACVNVCVAVQVIDAPGGRLVPGQLRSSLSLLSPSMIPVSVTFPLFVTRYE